MASQALFFIIWDQTNESNNKKEKESDYEPLWGPVDTRGNQPFRSEDEGKSG